MGGSQAGVRYQIALEKEAQRSLAKGIDKDIVESIVQRIGSLDENPRSLGRPLKGPLKGKYRLTVRRDY